MNHDVLIIEQGFLRPRGAKPVHGVELFRLNLIRALLDRGIGVTVVAEKSWGPRVEAFLQDPAAAGVADAKAATPKAELVLAPPIGGVTGAGFIGAVRAGAKGRRWRTVLFGNARLGMVPAMHWAQWMGLGERYVLFAHRDPGGNFLDSVATLRFDVVANSEWVAAWYRGQVPGRVSVCYGLASAERFYPRATDAGAAGARGDGRTHLVLLGRLPNISKGQERALAALRELPEAVRGRVHLHLASFAQPPELTDPCVTAHPWMPPDRVGEFLRGMDAMLAISTHETFSQAIVQGMLTGLPIIASDLPVYVEKLDALAGADGAASARDERARDVGAGRPEVRRGGLLCRSNAEIGAAIEVLAGDAALRARLGAEGRSIALARYVWDTDHFIREHLFAG